MNYDEIPFDSSKPSKLLEYRCKLCGFEEKVPDFVANESYTSEEFDNETGCPTVMCIKCDGPMINKKFITDY